MKRLPYPLVPVILLVLSACGSLADPEDPPIELASFDGTLTNPSGLQTSGDLHVAVIWFGGTAESSAGSEGSSSAPAHSRSGFPGRRSWRARRRRRIWTRCAAARASTWRTCTRRASCTET